MSQDAKNVKSNEEDIITIGLLSVGETKDFSDNVVYFFGQKSPEGVNPAKKARLILDWFSTKYGEKVLASNVKIHDIKTFDGKPHAIPVQDIAHLCKLVVTARDAYQEYNNYFNPVTASVSEDNPEYENKVLAKFGIKPEEEEKAE